MAEPHPRIALAAVLTTGVVGVVGAIATYKASHDAQQVAARAQRDVERESAHAESVKHDRVELRAVLDRAQANLDGAESAIRTPHARWLSHRHSLRYSSISDVLSAVEKVQFSEGQLVLRLPTDSSVTQTYVDAHNDLDQMVLAFGLDPTPKRERRWEQLLRSSVKHSVEFRYRASRLTRSVLK
jgi:hypothetical protein